MEGLDCPGGGGVHLLEPLPSSGALLWSTPVVTLCGLGLVAATQQAHNVIVAHEEKHPYSLSSSSP